MNREYSGSKIHGHVAWFFIDIHKAVFSLRK